MAIYTTFFLCRPDELPSGFPGWQSPLAQPRRREFRNPFTGEMTVAETLEPEWPEEIAEEEPVREYQVVAMKGRYEDYLEDRLSPFVRNCPHWAAKGLTEVELEALCGVVGVESVMKYSIYSPPSSGSVVQQLPPELLAKFGSMDQETVAKQWAATMSTPDYTHSVSGVKLSDGWEVGDALDIIQQLVALAAQASSGQQLYLLTEP